MQTERMQKQGQGVVKYGYFTTGKGPSKVTNNIFKTKCFRLWVGGFDGVSF